MLSCPEIDAFIVNLKLQVSNYIVHSIFNWSFLQDVEIHLTVNKRFLIMKIKIFIKNYSLRKVLFVVRYDILGINYPTFIE